MPAVVAYSAETIPSALLKTLLETYWDTRQNDEIPLPVVVEVTSEEQMQDLNNQGDRIIIRSDTAGEREQLRDSWKYKDTTVTYILTLQTVESRQRLYDLKQEIRRLMHVYMHNKTLTGFQALIYDSFLEKSDLAQNFYEADIRIRLVSVGCEVDI